MTEAPIDRAVAKWRELPPAEQTPATAVRFASRLRHTTPLTWTHKLSRAELIAKLPLEFQAFLAVVVKGQQNAAFVGPTKAGKSLSLSIMTRCVPEMTSEKKIANLLRRYQGSAFKFALQELTERRCLWVNVPELAEECTERKLGEPMPRIVHRAKTVPVLFLDDIGSEGVGARDALYTIGNSRYQRGLWTFISSGKSLDDLDEVYGDSIIRRLTERHGQDPLVCEVT